jgi:perosamine synthetase
MAVTNAILSARAIPVFVDIDPQTLNIDPARLEALINENTRAIIIVHTLGIPAAAAEIIEFARRHSLAVIEDACEALGSELDGHKAGTLAEIGTFAFYPNKLITTGEGGALVTSSSMLAARVRSLRNQGRQPGTEWFQHGEAGFSYRLADINCALGLQQLSRIEEILCRREKLATQYARRLKGNMNISCGWDTRSNARMSWFTYPVLLKESFTARERDEIWAELRHRGIESGRYFAPSHLQPALRGMPFLCGDLTETISISERLLCLPIFHSLNEKQIEFVCASLDEILTNRTAHSGTIHAVANS